MWLAGGAAWGPVVEVWPSGLIAGREGEASLGWIAWTDFEALIRDGMILLFDNRDAAEAAHRSWPRPKDDRAPAG